MIYGYARCSTNESKQDINRQIKELKEVSVNLVKKLCDGLEITLGEFFSAPVFDELEQEIQ